MLRIRAQRRSSASSTSCGHIHQQASCLSPGSKAPGDTTAPAEALHNSISSVGNAGILETAGRVCCLSKCTCAEVFPYQQWNQLISRRNQFVHVKPLRRGLLKATKLALRAARPLLSTSKAKKRHCSAPSDTNSSLYKQIPSMR